MPNHGPHKSHVSQEVVDKVFTGYLKWPNSVTQIRKYAQCAWHTAEKLIRENKADWEAKRLKVVEETHNDVADKIAKQRKKSLELTEALLAALLRPITTGLEGSDKKIIELPKVQSTPETILRVQARIHKLLGDDMEAKVTGAEPDDDDALAKIAEEVLARRSKRQKQKAK